MDIASLGFSIDTSDVQKAETALDGLNQAGAKTEAAAKGVGQAWSEVGSRTGTASAAIRQGNEAIRAQQQDLAKLLGQINPVVAALDRLDDQEQKLRGFKASGLLDSDTFVEYQGRLDQARKGLSDFDGNLRRTGITAAQTANAVRMLPAQFSDIFISLQAGQSPLQVFLQQGSQIKDSFGSAGAALRETAKFAAGLINPYTLAAAAAAALAIAWKQGSDEAVAFNRALILTGNYSGTSAEQLQNMAKAIDGVSGTQRQAAAALAEVAGAGKFTAEQLQGIATAAVAFENATGKAISETVSEFKRLADEPVAASARLNEQYNYLTASVYEQIAALQEQGDEAGAAELAIDAFGEAMQRRAVEIEVSLGLIERAWKAIKDGAAEAWDEMLGVGRPQTLEEQLAQLNQSGINGGELASQSLIFGPLGAAKELYDQLAPQIRELTEEGAKQQEQERARLELAIQRRDAEAKAAAETAKINQDAISAQEQLSKSLQASRSNAEKLADEYKRIDKLVKDAAAGGVQYSDEQVQQLRAAAAERFKDRAPRKTPEFRDDAATRLLLSLREQEASLAAQLSTTEKLSSEQRKRVEFEQQIADLKNKAVLTAEQKSLLANQDAIRAQLDKNVALAEEVELRKQAADEARKLAAFQQTLNEQLAGARDRYQLDLAGQGLGRRELEQLREQLRLEQQFGRQQSRLQEQFNRGDISESLYQRETEALRAALEEQLRLQQDYYHRLGEEQQEWSNGARSALADYMDSAKDVSGQTYDLFSNALSGLEDVFVEFAMTGKLSFKDLVNSILADLARIAARQLTANLAGGLADAFGGGSFTPSSGPSTRRSGGGGDQAMGLLGLLSSFAGLFDSGGSIRAGQWGIVGERGPEIVSGPANVVGRQDTARMLGGGGLSIGQMVFPGITNANEARIATAQAGRELMKTMAAAQRYT